MNAISKWHLTRKTALGGAIALCALAALGVTALASAPGGGFVGSPPSRGTLAAHAEVDAGGITFQAKDPVDVLAGQTVVIPPGGFSGWHWHPGFALIVVKAGAVTITVGCSSHTYSAGQAFYETGTTPTEARNNGPVDVVALTTYVVPHTNPATPARIEATAPNCNGEDASDH